jgi:proprotein convertase subtilisin/kexin type 5
MTTDGGGWTLVGFDNFESGSATGWSSGTVDSSCTATLTSFLGGAQQFGMGAASERVYDLRSLAHTEARVLLDYLVLDSWDGELAIVEMDGAAVYNTSFLHSGQNLCGSGFGDHTPEAVVSQTLHTNNTLTVRVTSTLDQDPSDESFGVDNIRVMVR